MNERARIGVAIAVLGLVGVASIGLAPLETILPPEAGHVPRAALLIQPAVLMLVATVLGAWAAPQLGLGAPVIEALVGRRPARDAFNRLAVPALIGAVAVALILLAYGAWSEAVLPVGDDGKVRAMRDFQVPLVSRLLYGGLSEEVLGRWGLMSLLALGAVKLGLARGRALWAGNMVAALLFAAGHIPLLMLLMPSPPLWMVGAVLIGNMIPGLIFGWLFQHRGLEAAMLAHAGGHLLATLAS
jgi:Type II CAAX prenyl endopeptidase Rce1-like